MNELTMLGFDGAARWGNMCSSFTRSPFMNSPVRFTPLLKRFSVFFSELLSSGKMVRFTCTLTTNDEDALPRKKKQRWEFHSSGKPPRLSLWMGHQSSSRANACVWSHPLVFFESFFLTFCPSVLGRKKKSHALSSSSSWVTIPVLSYIFLQFRLNYMSFHNSD